LFLFQHRRVNTAFYPEVLSGNRKLIEETIGGWLKEQIVKTYAKMILFMS